MSGPSGTPRYTPEGLPIGLRGWDLAGIGNQVRCYPAARLLELRDLAEPGTLWRDLLSDEIIRRCQQSTNGTERGERQ